MRASGFHLVTCPYTGAQWAAVPAISPDWAVIHVQEADAQGNCRIAGPKYDDLLLAKASEQVLVTTERLVDCDLLAARPELTDLPGFLVSVVVLAPGGAWPHGCYGEYPADDAFFGAYLEAAASGSSVYENFLLRRALPGAGVAP